MFSDLSAKTQLVDYFEVFSLPEFKEILRVDLSHKECSSGWVFQKQLDNELAISSSELAISNSVSGREIKDNIKCLMKEITSFYSHMLGLHYMVQFWAPEVVNQHLCLTTLDQPFAVSTLSKGICWYRHRCMGYRYRVDEGAAEEELGAVGRVYRYKRPESIPYLNHNSTKEFPHVAAACGFRSYLALPIFDLREENCYGVIEVLSTCELQLSTVDLGLRLKAADLTSTHLNIKLGFTQKKDAAKRSKGGRTKTRQKCSDDKKVHFRSDADMDSRQENASNKTKRGKRETGCLNITLQDLEPWFGQPLNVVAGALHAGRSTIKRRCRYYHIHRWPGNENQKKNLSLFMGESAQDSQQNMHPSCLSNLLPYDMPLHQNAPHTNPESSQGLIVQPKDDIVVIKAKYEEDTVKFELSNSAGMEKLTEEVAMRLNLKMGSFKLKYLDEDNDEILLTSDADLQLCLNSLTEVGRTCIQVRVQSVDPHWRKLDLTPLTIDESIPEVDIIAECQLFMEAFNSRDREGKLMLKRKLRECINLIVQPKDDMVVIKAKYEEDIVKFELSNSAGMEKLTEEVAMRLNLKMGSLKLKYLDEDNDEILLTCNADLQLYLNSLTAVGRTCLQVCVQSVDLHWRKLDLTPFTIDESIPEVDITADWQLFMEAFNSKDREEKLMLKRKLRECIDPSTTFLVPPVEKVKTEGRQSAKDTSTYRDSSCSEIVESGHGSASPTTTAAALSSKAKKMEKHKVCQSRHCSKEQYASSFHPGLLSSINLVTDVESDGNCGFRAIAGLLGMGEDSWRQIRGDLLSELQQHQDEYIGLFGGIERVDQLQHSLSYVDIKFAPRDKWMTMPDMGHLIASHYNVVLLHLSPQQPITFLPLRSTPLPLPDRQVIILGFVNDNHFVQVFMMPEHPMPPIASSWHAFRYDCAREWETPYKPYIESFKKLVEPKMVTVDIVNLDVP